MLSITRQVNEMVRIGDDLTIQVLALENEKVKLKVFSPEGDSIHNIAVDGTLNISPDVRIMATKIVDYRRVRFGITAPNKMRIERIPT